MLLPLPPPSGYPFFPTTASAGHGLRPLRIACGGRMWKERTPRISRGRLMGTAPDSHGTVPASVAEAVFSRLFFTPEGRADPYPLYRQLREVSPVHRSSTLGVWVLSRYDDCWAALRDPRFGKDY